MGVCLWDKKSLVVRVWIGMRRSIICIIGGRGKRRGNEGEERGARLYVCMYIVKLGKARRAGTYDTYP